MSLKSKVQLEKKVISLNKSHSKMTVLVDICNNRKSIQQQKRHLLQTRLGSIQTNISFSPRRLQDILKTSSKTSWKFLQDVFKMCLQDVLQKLLQDVKKTSSRRVYNTSSENAFKRSSKRLQDVFQDVFKTSSRRLQDVLTRCSWRRLEW